MKPSSRSEIVAVPHRSPLGRKLESKEPRKRPFLEYRRFIQKHYNGLPGALCRVTGVVTGHAVLGGQIFRPEAFDVRGCKRILDAGCGDGRYSCFMLRRIDPDATITGFDLSSSMLRRARKRLKSVRASHAIADLTRLPFADGQFDAVVCAWVLEHLPDPRPGLLELARVLQKGGKLLLMSTEDTLLGAMCSRMWHCRTYNRSTLREACREIGLKWKRELWFSPMHRLFKLGGIVVELQRE